jgi:bifunctional DNA-binding transcriptional regulator/antitoxin component of YhaV-PrlF toxin-antitoxin module
MVKIQENSVTKALLVQIPKAIAEAKGLKKGDEIKFLVDSRGRIVLNIENEVK